MTEKLDKLTELCHHTLDASIAIEGILHKMERSENPLDYIDLIRHRLTEMETSLKLLMGRRK